MSYFYLDNIATADVVFKATGPTREEMFISSADALMNVMVQDLTSIQMKDKRKIHVKETSLEMLLFAFLQELVYYKDADQLLLKVPFVNISQQDDQWFLTAVFQGEKIDPHQHDMIVDVKAVTLHQFCVQEKDGQWQATVVLDI